MLQTRSGKRTAKAALKIAVDMAGEGLISREEAVMRIDPASLDQLLHPTIDPHAARDIIARACRPRPVPPPARSCSPRGAVEAAKAGRKVILVRVETSPEDIHGMHAAEGILTTAAA
jgi:pyruvate,orthophosphate dikinase